MTQRMRTGRRLRVATAADVYNIHHSRPGFIVYHISSKAYRPDTILRIAHVHATVGIGRAATVNKILHFIYVYDNTT